MNIARHRYSRLLAACLALAAVGCDEPDPGASEKQARFEQAIPRPEVLQVVVPGAATLPQPGDEDWDKDKYFEALAELPSNYHRFTLHTTTMVNLGLTVIAEGIRRVKDRPPLVEEDDRLVWVTNPDYHPQFGLVVEREDETFFRYQLLRRMKASPNVDWRVVIAGQGVPAPKAPYGQGAVWINLDADLDPDTTGTVLALWSDRPTQVVVSVFYYRAWLGDNDTATKARDAVYHYVRERDGSGVMVFAGPENVDAGELGERPEKGAMITRWDKHGAGRSDVTASGGDLARLGFAKALRSECWAPGDWAMVYQQTWVQRPGGPMVSQEQQGNVDACAFAEPGKAALPPQGEEPPTPEPAAF